MEPTTAVVAGATGMTGHYLLNVLSEDSFYDRVLILSRRPAAVSSPKFRALPAAFESLRAEDLPGATHLFCCLGTTMKKAGSKDAFRRVDYEYPLRLAEAGRAAGARVMMLISSVGADPGSFSFYLRVKGELEEALRGAGFEALHLFRPSILLGRREEARPGEQAGIRMARAFEFALRGRLSKYRPMPAGVLAAAMAAAGERGGDGVRIHHYREILQLSGLSGENW